MAFIPYGSRRSRRGGRHPPGIRSNKARSPSSPIGLRVPLELVQPDALERAQVTERIGGVERQQQRRQESPCHAGSAFRLSKLFGWPHCATSGSQRKRTALISPIKGQRRSRCAIFAGCRPLGTPRIAPAARRQGRKGYAGGRIRSKSGISGCQASCNKLGASQAMVRTQAISRGREVAWGGISENGVLGVENYPLSTPKRNAGGRSTTTSGILHFKPEGVSINPLMPSFQPVRGT